MATDPITTIVAGVLIGIGFGINGYVSKRSLNEKFNPKKFIRTVVIFGAAGALIAFFGEPLTQENIVAATGATAVVGKVVDEWWAWFRRR